MEQARELVRSFWPNVHIAYSYKTNPLLSIRNYLHSLGAWAEVTSNHEIYLAKQSNINFVIYDGIYKPENEILCALKIGAKIIIDGEEQVRTISHVAQHYEKEIEVGLRISTTGILNGNIDKFGFEYSEKSDYQHLINALGKIKNIKICGLQCHLGTDIADASLYEKAAIMLGDIYISLLSAGICISWIDIGGGFVNSNDPTVFLSYAKAITRGFKKTGVKDSTLLIIEPGRALVENAGVLVTQVIDIRTRRLSKSKYVVVDSGTNYAMPIKFINDRNIDQLTEDNFSKPELYTIAGNLCAGDDIFANNIKLKPLSIGDKIIIFNVGAYDISTSYSFSRLRPLVYFAYRDSSIKMVRKTENTDYVLALEVDNSLKIE